MSWTSTLTRGGPIVLATAFVGCAPPAPPLGFVSLAPGERGQVDLSAAGGGGANTQGGVGGGATIHVEPYASPKTSIPIDAWAGHVGTVFGGGRVGARHRLNRHLSLGGGLAAAYPTSISPDFELVTGWTGTKVAGSFGVRPGLQFVPGEWRAGSAFVTTDFTFRALGPRRRGGFDMSVFLFGGPTFEGYSVFGGGIGFGGGGLIAPRRSRRR